MKATTYRWVWTTRGDARGACHHRHRTAAGALRCLARDRAGCVAQGGYSDRRIMVQQYLGRGTWTTEETPHGALDIELADADQAVRQ